MPGRARTPRASDASCGINQKCRRHTKSAAMKPRSAAPSRSAFLFVFLFFGRAEAGRGTECFAIVVKRKVAHVQREHAAGRLLVDDHCHRAAFHALAER